MSPTDVMRGGLRNDPRMEDQILVTPGVAEEYKACKVGTRKVVTQVKVYQKLELGLPCDLNCILKLSGQC